MFLIIRMTDTFSVLQLILRSSTLKFTRSLFLFLTKNSNSDRFGFLRSSFFFWSCGMTVESPSKVNSSRDFLECNLCPQGLTFRQHPSLTWTPFHTVVQGQGHHMKTEDRFTPSSNRSTRQLADLTQEWADRAEPQQHRQINVLPTAQGQGAVQAPQKHTVKLFISQPPFIYCP